MNPAQVRKNNLKMKVATRDGRPTGVNPNVSVGGCIPIRELLHIQSMCDEGKTDSEIATALGLNLAKVASIIADEGWRSPPSEISALKAKETAFAERWKRAIAAQARYLSLRGMDLAAKKVLADDAMGFALSARGTKAFVDMALQAQGESTASDAPVSSINLFFFAGEAKPVDPKSVSPNPVGHSGYVKPDLNASVLDVDAKSA